MKTTPLSRFAVLVASAVLAGCAAQDASESFRQTETRLQEARDLASADCATPAQCARKWALARAYVEQHSPTRIERADERVIEVAVPHEWGVAYFQAEKVDAGDGRATIRLKGMCRGMYRSEGGPAWLYASCAEQIREAQAQFRRFVDGAH